MSDTPETDANLYEWAVEAELSRKLERERDEARRIAEHMKEAASTTAVYDVYKTKLPWENESDDGA
jgi:hypothetical protein